MIRKFDVSRAAFAFITLLVIASLVFRANDSSAQALKESSRDEVKVELVLKLPCSLPLGCTAGAVREPLPGAVEFVRLPADVRGAPDSIYLPGYSSSDLSPPIAG